jgi:hypothetical protein
VARFPFPPPTVLGVREVAIPKEVPVPTVVPPEVVGIPYPPELSVVGRFVFPLPTVPGIDEVSVPVPPRDVPDPVVDVPE